MIVEGFIVFNISKCIQKNGKMTDKNKENRFTIKTRIFNCMYLR